MALGKVHGTARAKANPPAQSRGCQMDIALGDFGQQLQTKLSEHLQNLTSAPVCRFTHFSGSARSILKDLPFTFASTQ